MNGITNFITWLFGWLYEIIKNLVDGVMYIIDTVLHEQSQVSNVLSSEINIALFSDVIIWNGSVYDLLLFIITLVFTLIAVRLIWKILRKIFRKLFAWDRW